MTWVAGVAGTSHGCPAKEDQSQTTSLLPIHLTLSAGARCTRKVPEKVFQHPVEDTACLVTPLWLQLLQGLNPAMQDWFCDVAVASK